jgi:hypothetical protein
MQRYIIKIGHIYLEAVRQAGYGFSSERADAREYTLEKAEQIAGDIIAKGFALDPADVSIENAR